MHSMPNHARLVSSLRRRSVLGLGLVLAAGSGAWAQSGAAPSGNGGSAPVMIAVRPEAATLRKMMRRVTVDLQQQRLEDVVKFLGEVTGAEIEPLWRTDSGDGLDRDAKITFNARNMTALDVLERVLSKAATDFQQNQWQMTTYGSIEIGPKDLLNRSKRTEIYDIADLLHVVPNHSDAPEIDLQSVLQQSQGGGGSNIFRDDEQERLTPEEVEEARQARIQQIVDIITGQVETEQWRDNGGDGGTITSFGTSLIINAPDYMHRQINGYPYWSTRRTSVVNGRRYVGLSVNTGTSTVDGVARQPVSAVVGGQVIRSDEGGGG